MTLTYIREYQEDGGIFSEPGAEPGAPQLIPLHIPGVGVDVGCRALISV